MTHALVCASEIFGVATPIDVYLGVNEMLKQKHVFLTALLAVSTPAFAGGSSEDIASGAADSASTQASGTASSQADTSTSQNGSASAATNLSGSDATFAQGSAETATSTQTQRNSSGFIAIEDEQLEIDTSAISDGDGLGSIQIQWQISNNGDDWMVMPGAITPTFTPRDAQVGKYLRVMISYVDGQGNPEMLISPMSQPVQNVNDKPVGAPSIAGEAREGNTLKIDTSRITDEDGIGSLSFTWERSTTKTDWQSAPELLGDSLVLDQVDVGFSYRATVSYIDGFGTRETLTTEGTELVANVDNPLEGDVTVRGQAVEGNQLVASTSALTDYDGIASMLLFWESSADGRTWDVLDYANGESRLLLDQKLVGLKIRSRANVVDSFGVETVVTSNPTDAVRNVNNKPSGQLLIRRIGS